MLPAYKHILCVPLSAADVLSKSRDHSTYVIAIDVVVEDDIRDLLRQWFDGFEWTYTLAIYRYQSDADGIRG